MKDVKISDAELEVMKALWSSEGALTSAQVRAALNNGWERTTVLTLLSRLADKGAVEAVPQGRGKVYRAIIRKKEYAAAQARSLIAAMYNGSIRDMMAAMYSDGAMEKSDIQELRELIENWEGADD